MSVLGNNECLVNNEQADRCVDDGHIVAATARLTNLSEKPDRTAKASVTLGDVHVF